MQFIRVGVCVCVVRMAALTVLALSSAAGNRLIRGV